MSEKTALYRHFDKDGKLLYVGISKHAISRLSQHEREKHWSNNICSVTIEYFETRKTALQAEERAIRIENPIYNIQHNKREIAPVRQLQYIDEDVVQLLSSKVFLSRKNFRLKLLFVAEQIQV